MVAYTIIYFSAANSMQSNYILNVACDFYSCSRLQRKCNLETYSEKLEVDTMIPSLVSEGQVSR